jgi:hypothetical protein
MDSAYLSHLRASVDRIRADGFYKSEAHDPQPAIAGDRARDGSASSSISARTIISGWPTTRG